MPIKSGIICIGYISRGKGLYVIYSLRAGGPKLCKAILSDRTDLYHGLRDTPTAKQL